MELNKKEDAAGFSLEPLIEALEGKLRNHAVIIRPREKHDVDECVTACEVFGPFNDKEVEHFVTDFVAHNGQRFEILVTRFAKRWR